QGGASRGAICRACARGHRLLQRLPNVRNDQRCCACDGRGGRGRGEGRAGCSAAPPLPLEPGSPTRLVLRVTIENDRRRPPVLKVVSGSSGTIAVAVQLRQGGVVRIPRSSPLTPLGAITCSGVLRRIRTSRPTIVTGR